jgi:hypothetical protein
MLWANLLVLSSRVKLSKKNAGNMGALFLDCLMLEDPLGEPGRTPLYVGLPSVWGSMDGDLMFFPICRSTPFWGLQQTYMNE